MLKIRIIFKVLLISVFLGLFTVTATSIGIYFYLKPELPSMDTLKDVRFQIPLRVFTQDEKLIAEFGEQRRTPIKYDEVPDAFIKAVLAAEDQNFFKHSGVDIKALLRAVKLMIQNKGSIRGGGGSTITMQLTRALFLNKDRKFKRKFKEIILTYQNRGCFDTVHFQGLFDINQQIFLLELNNGNLSLFFYYRLYFVYPRI